MDEEVMSDVAFRVGAVEQMRAGANVALLSRDLGVSRWALYRWKKIYEKEGPAGWQWPRWDGPCWGELNGLTSAWMKRNGPRSKSESWSERWASRRCRSIFWPEPSSV